MSKAFDVDISQLDFSRVAIIGCPGSGKTTLSYTLQQVLGREVVHLDKVLWNPNWQMVEYDERVKIHGEIISQENWIVDGMWKSHLVERFQRATLVLFLDYRRGLCLRRTFKRRIMYSGKQRQDIADGCLEKLDGYFLKYVWTFRKNVRPLICRLVEENPQIKTVVFQNPKQTDQFVEQLKKFVQNVR